MWLKKEKADFGSAIKTKKRVQTSFWRSETFDGWMSYVFMQLFAFSFVIAFYEVTFFQNISALVLAWLQCMSLLILFFFIIFAHFNLLSFLGASDFYAQIKRCFAGFVFLSFFVLIGYNMKSVIGTRWEFSQILFVTYIAVFLAVSIMFLKFKKKLGYQKLFLKSSFIIFPLLGFYFAYSGWHYFMH